MCIVVDTAVVLAISNVPGIPARDVAGVQYQHMIGNEHIETLVGLNEIYRGKFNKDFTL